MKLNCKNQTVFIGDNREVMLGLNSGCVDLICADPPFNKEKRFDHVFGTPPKKGKQKPGFDDKWDGWLMTPQRAEELALLEKCHPHIYRLCQSALEMHSLGMQGYLVMMATRLLECRRLLKTTGSIYLHCDPTANAYLRLLLDGIFGNKNFLNEIAWCYKSGGAGKRRFARKHDTILLYAKNAALAKFNVLKEKSFNREFKPYRFKGVEEFQDEEGRWYTLVNAKDYWLMDMVGRTSKERSGWATQKPIALYSRMILASSNPGDVVLDPFCGCATTLVAAENAGRKWIGIDRDEEAERQVILQLNKLNRGTEKETQDELRADWSRRIRIRHCDKKRKEHPVRNDLGEFEHYKKHFDELYRKQSGICAGCDRHYDAKVMHVDHDFPRAKGGQDNIENLQVLCSGCNSRKGTGTTAQLRAKNKRDGLLKTEEK